jgi:tRNA threonylcarbamoyl adenosine modification protein (Sua5/YciO/YrdC/YwlC family)
MKVLHVHSETPQKRYIKEAIQVFQKGGLVIYPTDSGYSLGCDAHDVKAIQKLYKAKKRIKKYWMALLFDHISSIPEYALVDNTAFKLIKQNMPGPYTFILPSQIHIARKLKVKRKEIGVRMPNHPVIQSLFEEGQGPILNTAARIQEEENYTNPGDISVLFKGVADLFLDIGEVQIKPTSIINLCDGEVELLRGDYPRY